MPYEATNGADMMTEYPEEWRPIPGYENEYEVSNWARVRRVCGSYKARQATFLRPSPTGNGRIAISLCKDAKKRTHQIASLVADAFLGPRPEGMQVNHKDGNPAVNWALNLEYTTPLENTRHAIENGLRGYGNARLRPEDVREIRRLKGSMRQKEIAAKFGVSKGQVQKIHQGECWVHIR